MVDFTVSGGIEWGWDNTTLIIQPTSTPESGYTKGIMPDYFPWGPWGFLYGSEPDLTLNIRYGVKNIGEYAFAMANRIGAIKTDSVNDAFPSSLVSIGHSAFDSTKETGLYIPDSVTSIADQAFRNNIRLSYLRLSNNITAINDLAFYVCSALTSIIIPNAVTSIGTNAFYKCSNLETVVMSSNVTTIGATAFMNCSKLKSIMLPPSLQTIGESAFMNCTALVNANIPSNVTSIGGNAFSGCTALTTNIILPSSLKTVGIYAFENAKARFTQMSPSSLESVGDGAFAGNTFGSITLASTATSIGANAFNGCGATKLRVNAPFANMTIGDNAFNFGSATNGLVKTYYRGYDDEVPSNAYTAGETEFINNVETDYDVITYSGGKMIPCSLSVHDGTESKYSDVNIQKNKLEV